MKYLKIIALLAILLILFSCTKNDIDTVVLLGKESYVKEITSLIPDTLLTDFESHFDIHKGYIPPKVEGGYRFSPKERVYSNNENWNLSVEEPDMYLRIENQHNRVAKFTLYETSTVEVDTVYIMGEGKNFTLYHIENVTATTFGYTIGYKRMVLFSGEMQENGIKNMKFATIILETKDGSGGALQLYEPGHYFIYKDGNGISEMGDWQFKKGK